MPFEVTAGENVVFEGALSSPLGLQFYNFSLYSSHAYSFDTFCSEEKDLHKRAGKSKFDKCIFAKLSITVFQRICFSKIWLSNKNHFYGRNLCSFAKHMLKVHLSNLKFLKEIPEYQNWKKLHICKAASTVTQQKGLIAQMKIS